MSYQKTTWVNDDTELNAENMNHIEGGIEQAYGQLLLAVDSVAPEECTTGDKYYNTETNKIYTATGTDTWGTTGIDAELGVFYIVLETQNIYTYDGETLISVGGGASGGGGDSTPIGQVSMYAGSTAPDGYLLCDGSAVSRTTYKDLYSVIGTTYGTGDGSTTFNLPNIKGKVVVMLDSNDTSFDTLGETGGSKYLQEHTHTLARGGQSFIAPQGGYAGVMGDWGQLATNGVSDVTTGNSGNLQPYIVLNYIIKATQTIPIQAEVVNTYSESQTNTYSCNYINGTVLYENQSGTTGNITLSDSVNNYRYIEIYYGTTGSGINCVKIIPSITNNCNFTSFNILGGNTYIYSTQTTISGTSITITSYARGPISSISYDANFNSIFKVIGYK